MSTLSAISWTSGGVQHTEVYAKGFSDIPYVNKDSTGFVSLGGQVKQLSAGFDAKGNPEVFGIGTDDAVYVNDGNGWISLGGGAKQISATAGNTVYAIGTNNAVYVNRGTNWVSLGGAVKQISAGLDAKGNPEVFGIGTDNAVYVNDGQGWVDLGGGAKQISATAGNTVYAIGTDNAVYVNRGINWVSLGGAVKQLSAGLDAKGNPEVFGIGTDNSAYANDGNGWVGLGGYVTEISAAAGSTLYARGLDVGSLYVSQSSSSFKYIGSVPLADPASDVAYSPPPASAPLYNTQPSYLDVVQGEADCWLLASFAEVSARNTQDIKNMFVYDGTTVDNGSTVGLYSVRFYSTNGTAFYVQVTAELPAGGTYYAHVGNALGTQALWVALAEKGYAEANALGLVTTGMEYRGCYSSLNWGDPAWALPAITGNPATDYTIDPTGIASAWNSGQLIVLCTGTPSSPYIVGSHCYALVGYNGSSFEIFNPWGTDSAGWAPGHDNQIYGLQWVSPSFISQNFTVQCIGTGAVDNGILTVLEGDLTEPIHLFDGLTHRLGKDSLHPARLR
jgi:hypothetical protein